MAEGGGTDCFAFCLANTPHENQTPALIAVEFLRQRIRDVERRLYTELSLEARRTADNETQGVYEKHFGETGPGGGTVRFPGGVPG